jgi:hypothetical protein
MSGFEETLTNFENYYPNYKGKALYMYFILRFSYFLLTLTLDAHKKAF